MALAFELEHAPDAVQEMLADPEFIVERSHALGELSAECEAEEGETSIVVTAHRRVERDLPAVLAKVFDAVQDMTVTETWTAYDDGSWACEQVIEIQGQPVTINGDIELLPTDDGGCVYKAALRAKARIPLIGGTVEKFVVKEVEKAIEKETEYLAEKLG
ncbi:MAG: DUF2505 domain-containing protein [Pseudomonadota bacterium]